MSQKNATISEKTTAEQLLLQQELEGFDGVSKSIFLKFVINSVISRKPLLALLV